MTRAGGLIAAHLALLLVAAQPLDASAKRRSRDVRPLEVRVDATKPALAVPRSFLGFSIEYPDLPDYTGTAEAPNEVFVRLLQGLGAYGNGMPSLRIGGNSGDQSWWNPAGGPRPPNVFNDLTQPWVGGLAATVARTGAPVILGLNLALNDPANAGALTDAVASVLPSGAISSLEVGNEPDLYTRPTSFYVGRRLMQRPVHRATYSFEQYAAELERYVGALQGKGLPLGAGGFATAAWDQFSGPLLDRLKPRLAEFAVHSYPLNTCGRGRTRPSKILISRLLRNRQAVSRVRRLATLAAQRGTPTRLAEANSTICGGVRGVSDTFATALWGTNALFGYLAAGVRAVNIHTWTGAFYAPLEFPRPAGSGGVVHPLYYAMLLFARATADGAQLLPTDPQRAPGAQVWAMRSAKGVVRVVIVNHSRRIARRVRVRLPTTGPGSLELLQAPGLSARAGVTLGGRTFGSSNSDGLLRGRKVQRRVVPRGNAYPIRVPPVSAALLSAR